MMPDGINISQIAAIHTHAISFFLSIESMSQHLSTVVRKDTRRRQETIQKETYSISNCFCLSLHDRPFVQFSVPLHLELSKPLCNFLFLANDTISRPNDSRENSFSYINFQNVNRVMWFSDIRKGVEQWIFY